MGTIMMIPAAERRFRKSPSSPLNNANPTGRVTASLVVIMRANKNSFHAMMKQKIPAVISPSAAMGKTILRMTCNRVEPSTRAASSVSSGMPSINPLIIQMAKGMTREILTRIRPRRVSNNPKSRKSTKKGRTITTAGTNCVAKIITNNKVCPLR